MKVVALIVVVLLACLALVQARELSGEDYKTLFTSFIKKYNKEYSHDEFFNRFLVFKNNYDVIRIHNQGNSTWSMSVNEFADMTFAEFHDRHTGLLPHRNPFIRSLNAPAVVPNFVAPTSVDWRQKNAVTDVKNQQQCGSCWAFSTTGSLEGAWAIHSGNLVSLSEQQLVDCSTAQGNQGCNGGLMDQAFEFVIANKGICSEASYGYTASQGTCQTTCESVTTISAYKDVPAGNENALLVAATQQPISVAIEADQQGFQFYSGGVYADSGCGTQLDHGVLVVGFGHDSGVNLDYWIVKNSWGAQWGESGYIRLVRGQNQCGLANMASYPVV